MIGIDLWDKRVWIALKIEWVVVPHAVVPRVETIKKIKQLLQNSDTQEIVVGLPYDLYGNDEKQLDKTKAFIEKLKNIFPEHTIIGYDERYTTKAAESIIEKFWNKNKTLYKDDISAALILEWYIESRKNNI